MSKPHHLFINPKPGSKSLRYIHFGHLPKQSELDFMEFHGFNMWISLDFMGFHRISWDLFWYSGTSCTILFRTWWWVKHRLPQVEPHCAQLLSAPAARIFPTDCPSWPGIKFRVEGSKNIKHGCVTNWWLFMYFMLSIKVFEWFFSNNLGCTTWTNGFRIHKNSNLTLGIIIF